MGPLVCKEICCLLPTPPPFHPLRPKSWRMRNLNRHLAETWTAWKTGMNSWFVPGTQPRKWTSGSTWKTPLAIRNMNFVRMHLLLIQCIFSKTTLVWTFPLFSLRLQWSLVWNKNPEWIPMSPGQTFSLKFRQGGGLTLWFHKVRRNPNTHTHFMVCCEGDALSQKTIRISYTLLDLNTGGLFLSGRPSEEHGSENNYELYRFHSFINNQESSQNSLTVYKPVSRSCCTMWDAMYPDAPVTRTTGLSVIVFSIAKCKKKFSGKTNPRQLVTVWLSWVTVTVAVWTR